MDIRRLFSVLLFIGLTTLSFGQIENSVTVTEIGFTGIRRSKPNYLRREITIKKDSTYTQSTFDFKTNESRELLMNTLVFDDVIPTLTYSLDSSEVSVSFQLFEEDLFFLYPYFELLDRNFNEWWTIHNADLGRVSFAAASYFSNPTGTLDQLTIITQAGFNRVFDVRYERPYINKKKTLGFLFETKLNSTKSIPIILGERNEQLYIESDETVFNSIKIETGVQYKPKIRSKHTLKIGFQHQDITREAFDLNENFLNNRRKQQYFTADYEYRLDYRNIKVYPTKGHFIDFEIKKEGIGVLNNDLNTFYLTLTASKYFQLNKRLSLSTLTKGSIELLNNKIPFYNLKSLGRRDDYVRGYELFALDGEDYFLNKSSVHFLTLDKVINWGWLMPLKSFKRMPVQVYLAANIDNAYSSNDIDHELNNVWLTGFGPSLDFIFYGDIFLAAEYSFNHLGEKGLFLHIKLDF